MHISKLSLFFGVSTLVACGFASPDDQDAETDEADLSTACTGDYKKLSDLTVTTKAAWMQKHRVVDYDGDGHLDVVTPSQGTADDASKPQGRQTFELSILRGDGHGHLAAPVTEVLHAHATEDFTFADVNDDGLPDLVYRSVLDDYQQILRKPDGTWGAPKPLAASAACAFTLGSAFQTSLVVADVNGDGRRDVQLTLVAANASGAEHGRVTMLGTSNGLAAATCTKVPTSDAFGDNWYELRRARLGDFDGDGKTDLVGFGDLRRLSFALDIASPTPVPRGIGPTHNNISIEAVVGRFDKDSLDDAADLTPREVHLFYGDPTTPLTRTAKFAGLPPEVAALNDGSARAADLNGDGRPDFVFFSQKMPVQAGKRVMPTVCSRSTGVHTRYESRLPIDDPYVDLVGVGDFDEDRREDLVMVVRPQGSPFAPTAPGRFVVVRK